MSCVLDCEEVGEEWDKAIVVARTAFDVEAGMRMASTVRVEAMRQHVNMKEAHVALSLPHYIRSRTNWIQLSEIST